MGTVSFATRRICRFMAVATAGLCLAAPVRAQTADAPACRGVDYNRMILDILHSLPKGGGYDRDHPVLPIVAPLEINNRWELLVRHGHPSHCTSATYAIFLHLATILQGNRKLFLDGDQIRALEATETMPDGKHLVDGEGPFWIFNSNGAGTAALLHHTGTGFSFRDDKLAYAKPGDFLKLFWNKNVGASEKGHQVVYTGRRIIQGRDMVCFWGSQHPGKKVRSGHGAEPLYFSAYPDGKVYDGYGEVCRPREDIEGMIFSRVTCMEHLAAGLDAMKAQAEAHGPAPGGLPYLFVDDYLYKLRETSSDAATLDKTYGIMHADGATGAVGTAAASAAR
jgi:hypothetical protein